MWTIAQFEQALVQQPDDIKVLFALGNTASQLGLTGAAEQFFRRVLALEPSRLRRSSISPICCGPQRDMTPRSRCWSRP
jgi:cytochrome c-type biogenesis protein CcmH/NrfG